MSSIQHPRHTLHISCRSPEETFDLGERMGRSISTPVTIAITGDLGSGKTVFVKGLAKGLDVPPDFRITSPTFTIINEYPGRHPLFHVDLYRVADAVELEEIGFEEITGGDGVVAIEWAERIDPDDLDPDIAISITSPGPDERLFSIDFYGPEAANLVDGMKNDHRK